MTDPVPSKERVQPCPHGHTPDLCRLCMRDKIERLQRELQAAKDECIERFDQARHFAELSAGRATPEPGALPAEVIDFLNSIRNASTIDLPMKYTARNLVEKYGAAQPPRDAQ